MDVPVSTRSWLGTFFSRKENVYLVLALGFGTIMALLNPPFDGVPDEHAHYWKSWAIAMGNIRCRPGDKIPQSAYDLPVLDFPVRVVVPGVGRRIVFHETLDKLFAPDAEGLVGGVKALCNTNPVGYLPQVSGLLAGRLLHLNALGSFFLARIFNLAVSVFLIYLAIRIVPFGKIVFLLIGLLPMTLQQFASITYDPLHIAFCFLFTAYVLRLSNERDVPLRPREMALLFAVGLLAFNVKYGYIGLGLLVFMLPPGKFKSKRHYWSFCLGYLAAHVALFSMVYRFFQKDFFPPGAGGGGLPGVDMSGQFSHVVNSPVQFIFVFVNTLYGNMNFYLESFLFKPGWLTHSLEPMWYFFVLAGMVLLVRNEREAVPLTTPQRNILLLVFSINLLVVFFSLYLGWTKVGQGIIQGVQGRYLLGFFPLLLLYFYKNENALRYEFFRKHLQALLICFYLAVFGGAFLSVYRIYYDKNPALPLSQKIGEKLFGPE